MKTIVGLWVDHRKAIIVTVSNKGEKTEEIVSNVEKQLGRTDGKRSTTSFESQLVQADDRQQRGFTKHLKSYYQDILSHINNAQEVLIFGPGEAKGELKKLMQQENRHEMIVTLESVDKMTDRQIAAKVRKYSENSNKSLVS